jgi:hypothetical protein
MGLTAHHTKTAACCSCGVWSKPMTKMRSGLATSRLALRASYLLRSLPRAVSSDEIPGCFSSSLPPKFALGRFAVFLFTHPTRS